ncbi:MAG: ROK family protein [Lachnospiraceae bacterium]|nr:ROK family protein [Lachnospiraceae bacterium]
MRIAVVDIGGTNIKSGIWEDGEIKQTRETATNAKLGGGHVMETVVGILEEIHDFQAVGISTAGQVDTEKGMILYANDNIPGYTGTRIKETLEERFHVPVAVQNDVNSAAVGEAFYGAGKGAKDFLCLTYGTGVGGAIVIKGEVYNGAGYSAGEFGGIITHPEDRKPEADIFSGCYERYASTTALVKRVSESFPELVSGREIFAGIGVPEVKSLIDQWILEIVYGLVTLVHIFNPSLIVLGGGVMEQEYVVGRVKELLREHIMPSFRNVEIVSAKLGNTAGMLGAAKEVQKLMENEKKKS